MIVQRNIKQCKAFTLLELLVVIAIMSIFVVMAKPSLLGLFTGSALSRAENVIEDNLKYASQYAIANQRLVQVRFYNLSNPETRQTNPSYCAFQLFQEAADTGNDPSSVTITWKPLTKLIYLPNPIIILDDQNYSSLLYDSSTTPDTQNVPTPPALPVIGTNYTYRQLVFRGTGGTDLPNNDKLYFITLADSRVTQPTDYYTIKIDALSGKVTSYRP